MAGVAEEINWTAEVYQLEETDLVLGGPTGIANEQAKNLANRTLWLKAQLKGFEGITVVTANKTLVLSEIVNKLILVNGAANLQLTLPNLEEIMICTKAFIQNNTNKLVTISGALRFDLTDKSNQVLGAGETAELIWIGDKWLICDFTGNLTTVGNVFHDYKIRQNTVVCDGSLLTRANYPRLWEFANSLGSSLVTDNDWTTIPTNKGFFSSGNGSSNFRVPDLRSMFIRGLDLGAGVDIGRLSENPGGYEADEFKSHNHVSGSPVQYAYSPRQTDAYSKRLSTDLSGPNEYSFVNLRTDDRGGLETRPKNIGLIPLIKV